MIRFYQEAGIPIQRMITAGALEGGDVIIVEPGRDADRQRRGADRGRPPPASSPAGWRSSAGRCGSRPIPSQFVHIDVLVSILAPKLAAVCVDVAGGGLVRWLRDAGLRDPRGLGRGRVRARRQRDLARRRAGALDSEYSKSLNEQLRALGLEVFDPDLTMFTLGGGGAHCLAQALRRERVG